MLGGSCRKYICFPCVDHTDFENAVADKKERAELAQTKRENEFYKQNIDKAKALVAMSQRTRKHETGAASAAPSTTSAGASAGAEGGASSARKAAVSTSPFASGVCSCSSICLDAY